MKVIMKDLHLSCSEDMGPLNNINILSFQDNKEDLVRSFHSLPNPPYIVFTRKILNNKQPWSTPLTGLLPNPGTQSPPEIRYESNKNEIVTQLTLYYIASCRGRTDDLQRMRNLHRIKSKYELRIKNVPKIERKAKNLILSKNPKKLTRR